MGEIDFEKLITTGISQDAVPEGTYLFKVVDARSNEGGKGLGMVFLDLEVQEGPLAGQMTQVSLFIPDGSGDNPRGASWHFGRKIAGFGLSAEVGRAMNSGHPAPVLAETLVDQVFIGTVDVQGDGDYAGSNNLTSTKPADSSVTVPSSDEEPAKVGADEADDGLPF